MNRRMFTKVLAGTTAISFAACSSMKNSMNDNKKRVVIVGGGFGGATAAKYIKKFDSSVEVVLIEQNEIYHTCPFSNTVIAGMNNIKFIQRDYKTLASKYGIKVIHKSVAKIDHANNSVLLANGDIISYTKVLVSPGIDFKYEKGYVEGSELYSPHAYHAGAQTELLSKQLMEMKQGGTYVMVAPENPFRCPPGPYERISLVAHYLTKNNPTAKIVILDQKKKFSKQGLFTEGWEDLYDEMIEWRSVEEGGKVTAVNAKTRELTTSDGIVKADVLNYIPNQKAAKIAFDSGLNKGDWCPINTVTFESKIAKNVYMVGDATIASSMPKSGFSANSQAKVAAMQIVRSLKSKEPIDPPKFANTCYSLIAPEYGISVAKVYQTGKNKIAPIKGSGGLSPSGAEASFRHLEAEYALGWYQNQTADIFL